MAEARRPDTTFWVDPTSIEGDHLILSREESHHLVRVHRAAKGTPFTAVDGAGTAYDCEVESIEGDAVIGRITARQPGRGELPFALHVLVGLPEMGPAEAVMEHAVPLGASRIDFVACARSERSPLGEGKIERLDRIARAGLKQSRRCRSAVVVSSSSLAEAVAVLPPGLRVVADPWGGPIDALKGAYPTISLAVGPPGGFDPEEYALLARAGFQPISLGPSRLTTETATIALLSVARNRLLPKGLGQI
jgi:16S rRNA (uracil1498-N3)-methyltransferase